MRTLALLACLALAAPAQAQFNINLNRLLDVGKNVKQAATDVDEKEEIEIGGDMAARLLGAAPLVADEELQHYVNKVGRWLASQTERPGLPWHFGVLDAPQLNAFATPGGHIFVTRGLLSSMKNEAELAGVLAHEIAHVLRKHHLKAIQKTAQLELANTVVGTFTRQDDRSNRQEKLLAAGSELFARGLDKDDELEADRLGVVIAARAGYGAYGLPAVLQTLQAMNPADSGLALMFKTHPAPAERLGALEKMQPTLDAYAGLPQLAQRFDGAVRR